MCECADERESLSAVPFFNLHICTSAHLHIKHYFCFVIRTLLVLCCFLILHSASAQEVQDTVPPKPDTVAKPQQAVADTAVKKVVRRPRDTTRAIVRDTARVDSVLVDTVAVQPSAVNDLIASFKRASLKNPYFAVFAKPIFNIEVERRVQGKEIYFYVLLGLFFYFAVVKTLFRKYITNLVSIFLRITLRQQQLREQLLQAPLPSLMLNIFFLLTGGLYASLLLSYYQWEVHSNFWIQTLYCIGILALIYMGKFVILKFTGWVFNLSKATDTYIFIVFLVNKMLGLLLLPFLVLIAFYSGQPQQVFVTLSLILVLSLFAYRFFFSFGPIRAEIKVNPFHFFLYLCAFEIAPLLLIYKVLLSLLEKSI